MILILCGSRALPSGLTQLFGDEVPGRIATSQATSLPGDQSLWYDIQLLGVEGKGWEDTVHFFDRLPKRAKGVVRDPVWNLAHNSAGLCVRFVTNANAISARWTLRSEQLALEHMPATAVSGLDLYIRDRDDWRWLAVGRPSQFPTNQKVLVQGLSAEFHEFLLYLPLYNGVESVQVGLPADAILSKTPAQTEKDKPVCFYGTSITQGGCASRPGMSYVSILGRMLHRPVINLGFSGNGPMDLEMAPLLAELDPSAFVLDCLPNMEAAMVRERTEPFVKILRTAHPLTPIVLVENIVYTNAPYVSARRDSYQAKNAALSAAYSRLAASGIRNLYYVHGEELLGQDGEDTVDGTHPTDLGFLRIAEALRPVLSQLVR